MKFGWGGGQEVGGGWVYGKKRRKNKIKLIIRFMLKRMKRKKITGRGEREM